MDRLRLLTGRGAVGRRGGRLEPDRLLPLRRDRLLGDLAEPLLRLRQAGLEAQAALELRLGRLQVPALELVQARVVMVQRPSFALLPPVDSPTGDKEQPGSH